MGSRKDPGTMDQCLGAVKEKQTLVQEVPFRHNHLGVRQELESLREQTDDVKGLKRKVDELRKSKSHTKDFKTLDTEYSLLEDQALQKKRCLETVLYVTEVENLFQNVQAEFEERALYLTERRQVFDSIFRSEQMESSSRMHRDCVYALRNSWTWLGTVSRCMEIHLQNAAEYQQFFHDAQHLSEDMRRLLNWLNSERMREKVETRDTNIIIQHIREITNRLLDYQGRVERLDDQSKSVHPIHLRKDLKDYGVRANALVAYQHKEVSLKEGEQCFVMDNSDSDTWQIRTLDGTETEVPGVILVIPPPDRKAYHEAQKAKDQLIVNWDTTMRRLRTQLTQFLTTSAQHTEAKELYSISARQKADLLKLVNEATQVLRPQSPEDPDFKDLVAQATVFRKNLTQVKPGPRDVKNDTTQTWQANGRAFVLYKEFLTYAKAYKHLIASQREQASAMLCGEGGPVYSTKAYFEQAMPVVDIDLSTRDTKVTTVKAELYIHERRSGKTPVPPPRKRRALKRVMSAANENEMTAGASDVAEDKSLFLITGVIDPRTRKQLNVFQALSSGVLDQIHGTYNNPDTGETMSIPEAIKRGLIQVEFTDNMMNGGSDAFTPSVNTLATKSYPIDGVIDPRTGEFVGVKEAITSGIIDPKSGRYINPVTGEQMSILEAVQSGYLATDSANLGEIGEENGMFTFVDFSDISYEVKGVIDPGTGDELSLKRAIMDGVIDPVNSLFRNPHTGETMALSEAIKQGYIRAKIADPSADPSADNILTFKQLQIKKQRFCPGEADMLDDFDEVDSKIDPTKVLRDKLRSKHDVSVPLVPDSEGKRTISLEEGMEQGLIDVGKNQYKLPTGEVISLEEALRRKLVTREAMKQILDVYEDDSLGKLIKAGKFDPETGLVMDPTTGNTMSLKSAIGQRMIDPNLIFLFDVPGGRVISLAKAIDDGLINLETGNFVDPKTGEEISLAEAFKRRLLQPNIDPEQITENCDILAKLSKVLDPKLQCVVSPHSKDCLTLEEAVTAGLLNLKTGQVTDVKTGEVMSLTSAIRAEKIDPKCARSLLEGLDKLSLQKAIQDGIFDPERGCLLDPVSGKTKSIHAGIQDGSFNPNTVLLVDKANDNIVSLGALIESGRVNPVTGEYFDSVSGERMTLADAIARGLLDPEISADRYTDSTSTLRDLIDSNRVNPRSTQFMAPNNHSMSLREALANGFLAMNSKVKVDPDTGYVSLASDEEVVQALVEMKEHSDWLHSVEQKLGGQGKPSDKLEKLQQHRDHTKNLREKIGKHESEFKSSIKQAEELIENNKGEEKEKAAQQLQKLKYSSADLKVRLDSAFSEADKRCKRLDGMCDDLEQFYVKLQDLDHWLDEAIEKSGDLQSSRESIESQYSDFKDFVEELQGKEEEMAKVIKMSDNFRDQSHEFEKEAEMYRKRLQFLPPIQEDADDGDVIDDELESLESKYKDISRECAKHLDKLAALAKHKKAFDELNEKLSNVYPNIEQALSEISEDSFGKNPDQDARNFSQLKDLKADLIGQERKLKDLAMAGEKLIGGLLDMNNKKKADEVRKKMDDYKETHDSLSEEILGKEEALDAAVSQQQSVMNRVEALKSWASDVETQLDEKSPVSLDQEKLSQQLKDQRILNAEIVSNKALLERLSSEVPDVSSQEMAEILPSLTESLEDIERKAEQRTKELEDVSSSVRDLEGNIGQMENWVTEAIKSLKSKPKGANQKVLKAKVDALYGEKREKEFDMENIRKTSGRLMEDDRVCDQFALKESLGTVEAKWHELTELLVQQVSLEALTEVDGMLKYLDKAENEINTAEPISIDPETLSVQLKDHMSFNEDLNNKKNSVKDIIDKCNKMLRETTNAQTDEIKSRLESIKSQADIVCHLSDERLHQLEAALPLATSFSENQGEVQSWLDEMEAEVKAQGSPGETLEQIKKQYETMKDTLQIIEDRKPFIDDLNSTGLELMELCGDDDAGQIQNKLVTDNERYEKLKQEAREKARDLSDTRQKMTMEVSESLDNLLEDLSSLNRAILNADPIPANPDKLKDDLEENKNIFEDLERRKPYVQTAVEKAKKLLSQGTEDPSEAEDVKSKISEVNSLCNQIQDGGQSREQALSDALQVSEKFYDLCNDVMSNLRDLKDNIFSQEPPGVDPATVKEQQKELKELRKELGKARLSLDECRQKGEQLGTLVGEPGLIEIRKQLEDIHNLADDVHDIARDREEDLRAALGHADKFQQLQDSIGTWLPLSEHKLGNMRPISNNPETLRAQVDELKFFKSQIHPHISDIQQLNQELAVLKDMSPVAAETLQRPVDEANSKWADIIKGISEREAHLNQMQIKVGDLEKAMDDAVNSLEQALHDTSAFDNVNGDPKCLETHMKKLNLLQADTKSQAKACRKLNEAVDELLAHSDDENTSLKEKREEMNEMMRMVQADVRDKEAKMQEKLRQVKKFVGDVDDMLQWVNELRMELKSGAPFGALPDTAKHQFEKFQERHHELQNRDEATEDLLDKGQKIVESCNPDDVTQIVDKIRKLRERWNDTKERAQKRKEKMDEHLQNIDEFHGTLKTFTDWLNNAEITMRGFKYPSKLVEKVVRQMEEHNALRVELEAQSEKMTALDRTGTYLKYFGRKQDTIYIKNLLVGIRLRWKKLLRKTDERGRLFKQAYKEDKRFYDAWKNLCDWLDDSARTLAKFSSPNNYTSKQDMDDLKHPSPSINGLLNTNIIVQPCQKAALASFVHPPSRRIIGPLRIRELPKLSASHLSVVTFALKSYPATIPFVLLCHFSLGLIGRQNNPELPYYNVQNMSMKRLQTVRDQQQKKTCT